MSPVPVPSHVARTKAAETEGHLAGQEYEQLVQETCPPEQWTRTAQEEWTRLLDEVGTNPYPAHPYPDATDDQHAFYTRQWKLGFDRGRTARRNQLARKQAAA